VADDRLRGGPDDVRLFELFAACDGDDRQLRRESLDVLGLLAQEALRDQQRKVGVLVAEGFEPVVELALEPLPDGVAVRLDHHAALHDFGRLGHVALQDDVLIPRCEVLRAGGYGGFGHEASRVARRRPPVRFRAFRRRNLLANYYHSRVNVVIGAMFKPKLTKLELQVLEALWQKGPCSVREIQESFPEPGRPAYTTVQTVAYRLERKKALRCVKRIGNANIFEAVIARKDAQGRLIDELLGVLGGRARLVMAHLVESGELTLDDIKEAEKALRKSPGKEKAE
jgi:predicted transcriptional regulator